MLFSKHALLVVYFWLITSIQQSIVWDNLEKINSCLTPTHYVVVTLSCLLVSSVNKHVHCEHPCCRVKISRSGIQNTQKYWFDALFKIDTFSGILLITSIRQSIIWDGRKIKFMFNTNHSVVFNLFGLLALTMARGGGMFMLCTWRFTRTPHKNWHDVFFWYMQCGIGLYLAWHVKGSSDNIVIYDLGDCMYMVHIWVWCVIFTHSNSCHFILDLLNILWSRWYTWWMRQFQTGCFLYLRLINSIK